MNFYMFCVFSLMPLALSFSFCIFRCMAFSFSANSFLI